ncbi:MAG: FadR/GntR family transcriptional regulator [Spirochaetota bacterium]
MAKFKPIVQARISETVAEQLKESIFLGHFKSSDKLPPERELAKEFKVSRTAIREALRKLENSGFIITRQGSTGGAYVTDITFDHVADVFLDLFLTGKISVPELSQVRILVEPEVARLAALNINPEYAQMLKNTLDDEKLPEPSLSVDIAKKQRMHFILAEMCGNKFFEAIVRALMDLTKKVVEAVESAPQLHPVGMHNNIVKTVISGNGEAAFKAMKKHSIEFGKILVNMEKSYREKK